MGGRPIVSVYISLLQGHSYLLCTAELLYFSGWLLEMGGVISLLGALNASAVKCFPRCCVLWEWS